MLKLVDAKKICCVALATMFSISLCACKKTNEANETATTETSIEMGATATATTITTAIEESTDSLWYAEIQKSHRKIILAMFTKSMLQALAFITRVKKLTRICPRVISLLQTRKLLMGTW